MWSWVAVLAVLAVKIMMLLVVVVTNMVVMGVDDKLQ